MYARALSNVLILPVFAFAFSACGGGGASSSVAPIVRASPAVANGVKTTQSVTIVLGPRKQLAATQARADGKHRAYVSPSATGMILRLVDSTASTTQTLGYDVSPQSSSDTTTSCGPTQSNGTRSCTLSVTAIAGDSVTIGGTIYDAMPSPLGMNPTAQGNALATGTASATTIAIDTSNAIALTLEGIPARLESLVYGVPSVASFEKLPYFMFHVVDYDGNPIDAYDATDAFANSLTFGVTDHGDTSGCPIGKTAHCTAFNFDTTTISSTISEPYDNNSGDESQQIFFNNTPANAASGMGGSGDEGANPPYYAQFVSNPNTGAVANGSQSGIVTMAPLFAYPSSLSVTGSMSGTVYADQYLPPSGSPGYSATGCSNLLDVGSAKTANFGAAFSVTGLTNGSCKVALSDGIAADQTSATVSVGGFTTTQPTIFQMLSFGGSKGAAVASVTATLSNPPLTGNTLLLILSQGTTAVSTPTGYTSLANVATISNAFVGYAVFVKDVTSSSDQTVTVTVPGTTEALSYYFAEIGNTHASLISSVSGKFTAANSTSSTTPTITPDAPNTLVYTGASSSVYGTVTGADPYTVASGYAEAFDSGATSITGTPASSLDIQDQYFPTAAATTNTFTLGQPNAGTSPYPATEDFILYIRPKSS